MTAAGHGARIFEIVFDQDPLVTAEIRRQATQPDSIYSIRPIEKGANGVGQVTQDVILGR